MKRWSARVLNRISTLLLLSGLFLVPDIVASRSNGGEQESRDYRNRELAFKYPAGFCVLVEDQGATIRVGPRTPSAYWEQSITIRKLKKNAECDVPQDNSPDPQKNRQIAGQLAYAYCSEAALRESKQEGYLMKEGAFCWNFELIRKERSDRKGALPEREMKRLKDQGDRDWKTVEAAFKLILDSFAFVTSQR